MEDTVKLKGIHIKILSENEVVVTPQYWGKRGRTITMSKGKVGAVTLVDAIKQLLTLIKHP